VIHRGVDDGFLGWRPEEYPFGHVYPVWMSCSLQLVDLSMRSRHVKYLIRASSLGAFALTGPLHTQAMALAAKAYNEACSHQALAWPVPDVGIWSSLLAVGVFGLIVLLPMVCSRSNSVIGMNLVLSIATLVLACRLQVTAGTPPYECYSHNGTYEDRVSGLSEFDLWALLVLIVFYVAFFVDWLVWFVRRTEVVLGLTEDSRSGRLH